MKINVIYEDNHLLVVEKPINVPVQEDISKDLDLLNILKNFLKRKYNKKNNVYLGLVHRLDRPVGGIMVFAKTSKAASRLSKQITDNKFKKIYYAVVQGNIDSEGKLEDYLLKDKAKNIVKVDKRGKKSTLNYQKINFKESLSLVKITLVTGRSHQIRVQLSHYGFPLYGDQKYNKNAKIKEQIALFAKEISFLHPITNKYLTFKLEIPKKYPWNVFCE